MAKRLKPKQLAFGNFALPRASNFGGQPMGKRGRPLRSHPKTARIIATKNFMHVVLRSSLAEGDRSFLIHARRIQSTLNGQGARLGVQIVDIANAGNHIHLVVKARTRRAFVDFLRSVTGLIARIVLRAERNCPRLGRELYRFWDARPFSRVVTWGRDLAGVRHYLRINRIEMIGMARPQVRAMLARIERLTRECRLVPLGFIS